MTTPSPPWTWKPTRRSASPSGKNVKGTTILIAHRITTLMNADQILVLDHGRVSQMGTHQELIAQEGIYKKIYDMQSAGGEAS